MNDGDWICVVCSPSRVFPTSHSLEEHLKSHESVKSDNVNHPSHYTAYKGLEVIDLTEQMNFNRGNAVKYIARAGLKNPENEIEDLEKARWYVDREIQRLKNADVSSVSKL